MVLVPRLEPVLEPVLAPSPGGAAGFPRQR
jgi:hypothetical protein